MNLDIHTSKLPPNHCRRYFSLCPSMFFYTDRLPFAYDLRYFIYTKINIKGEFLEYETTFNNRKIKDSTIFHHRLQKVLCC